MKKYLSVLLCIVLLTTVVPSSYAINYLSTTVYDKNFSYSTPTTYKQDVLSCWRIGSYNNLTAGTSALQFNQSQGYVYFNWSSCTQLTTSTAISNYRLSTSMKTATTNQWVGIGVRENTSNNNMPGIAAPKNIFTSSSSTGIMFQVLGNSLDTKKLHIGVKTLTDVPWNGSYVKDCNAYSILVDNNINNYFYSDFRDIVIEDTGSIITFSSDSTLIAKIIIDLTSTNSLGNHTTGTIYAGNGTVVGSFTDGNIPPSGAVGIYARGDNTQFKSFKMENMTPIYDKVFSGSTQSSYKTDLLSYWRIGNYYDLYNGLNSLQFNQTEGYVYFNWPNCTQLTTHTQLSNYRLTTQMKTGTTSQWVGIGVRENYYNNTMPGIAPPKNIFTSSLSTGIMFQILGNSLDTKKLHIGVKTLTDVMAGTTSVKDCNVYSILIDNNISNYFNSFRNIIIEDTDDTITFSTNCNVIAKIVIDTNYTNSLGNYTTGTIYTGNGTVVGSFTDGNIPPSGVVGFYARGDNAQFKSIKLEDDNLTQDYYVPTDSSSLRDTYSDTWVATDDLDRIVPTNDITGNPQDKKVGMFYFLWHNQSQSNPLYDHNKTYMDAYNAAGGGSQGIDAGRTAMWNAIPQGTTGYLQYWGEPYLGYYKSDDEWVIRKHAQMFVNAGIDFIFFDCSNNNAYLSISLDKVFKTYHKMREEGLKTPQIAFFLGDNSTYCLNQVNNIYYNIYLPALYSDLWFMWDDKPLLLGNLDAVTDTNILNAFTVRKSWADDQVNNPGSWTGNGLGKWPWASIYPQTPGRSPSGVLEQLIVMCGFWANGSNGRSYNFDTKTQPSDGLSDFEFQLGTSGEGIAYEKEWSKVYEVDPSIVMITGWNEWSAGRWANNADGTNPATGQRIANTYIVDPNDAVRQNYYVDCFNPEFSRDIEPMKGGFGDNYYYQTVINVRKFKGVRPIEKASGQININTTGGFSQWSGVGPQYFDTLYDTEERDFVSNGGNLTYTNSSGRNDLESAKVSAYGANYNFCINTREDITAPTGENWMNLFIDSDQNSSTGWHGYDFLVNRSRQNGKASVEQYSGSGWNWVSVGEGDLVYSGNSLQVTIDADILNINGGSFDFKWADNSIISDDIMGFMDKGDTAPDDRFNFRFIPELLGYIECANEGDTYTLDGTCDVAYGANGEYNYLDNVSGTITFNNATFGDPVVGVAKKGYYKK